MSRRYRVAHYGAGHTGTLVLRQLIERLDVELVGHLVFSPEENRQGLRGDRRRRPDRGGRDRELDEFCALDVDCVTYMATEFGQEVDDVIDGMCRLLESGKNVVTTTFIRLVYPKSLPPDMLARLEKACAAGQSAFMGSGIAPGSPRMRSLYSRLAI